MPTEAKGGDLKNGEGDFRDSEFQEDGPRAIKDDQQGKEECHESIST